MAMTNEKQPLMHSPFQVVKIELYSVLRFMALVTKSPVSDLQMPITAIEPEHHWNGLFRAIVP